MKRIIPFLILFICSQAEAKIFIKPFDSVGVRVSSDLTVPCPSGNVMLSAGAGSWACGTAGGTGASVDAQYYTAASDATLTNEVVVTKSGVGSRMITGVSPFTSGRVPYFDVNGDLQASSVTSSDATAVTLAGENYLSLSGQQITAGTVALTTQTSGNYVQSVATTSPLTGGAAGSEGATLTVAIPAANATTNGYMPSQSMVSIDTLVAVSHDAVTLAGETYLSLSGQQITAADINLGSHVTSTLPVGNGGTGQTTATAAYNALATFDGTPDTDHTANGQSTATFNAGDTITVMDLVFMGPSGTWLKTDADSVASSDSVLAISLESKTAGQAMSVALSGSFVRDDTWNWTVGDTIYIDTTTQGGLTATQPSGTDDVVRVVGFAVTADVIYFAPSEDYFTHT